MRDGGLPPTEGGTGLRAALDLNAWKEAQVHPRNSGAPVAAHGTAPGASEHWPLKATKR
jgi:hypothetical protein